MGGDPSKVRVVGPLEPWVSGFASELRKAGYTEHATADQLRVFAHVSRWLDERRLGVEDLTPAACERFLSARRRAGYTLWLSPKALAPMLDYLRGLGVVPPPPSETQSARGELLERYRTYLVKERGLKPTSAAGYIHSVDPFLRRREMSDGSLRLKDLHAGDVTAFVVGSTPGRPVGSAKLLVCSLRSLLGFFHINGIIKQSLALAVPSVAGSRYAGLPKGIGHDEVERMLAICNRSTAVGRRDFAVLKVLIRLGLRAGEVVALRLEDVDWRNGEIIVRGKGDRQERLPLPVDVGRALAGYVHRGRPAATDCRSLFMRVRAPHRGLTSAGVGAIVEQAAKKAGLPKLRSHRLRHTAATDMLRAGASLADVGQVLRHRSALSTAIYAKVDRLALRQIARPWPGGGAA